MTKKIFHFLILFLVVLIAFFLRKQNYAEIPIPGQSTDEYSYSWVGLSLLQTGMPIGISGLENYQNVFKKYVNVNRFYQVTGGDPMTINYPWMDHPPLLGLITGGYAHLVGARVFEDTLALFIRRPMIIISTISVALVIIFCYLNFGFFTALFAGSIYGSIPLVVLSSRMIQAENALIPCLLLCLITISLYFKTKLDRWLLATALVAGVATLFKLTGFVCHLFVAFSLLAYYQKIDRRFLIDMVYFLCLSLPITGLFIFYGLAYDPATFVNIVLSNYHRFYGIGPSAIYDLIRQQRLTQGKILPEVWLFIGWFSFIISSLDLKKQSLIQKLIPLSVIAYLIVYIFFGSLPYGWYTFPFWPLLTIAFAILLGKTFTHGKHLITTMFLVLTLLGENIFRLIGLDIFQGYASWWRWGIALFLFLVVISSITKIKSKIIRQSLILILWAILIYTNIKYLNRINIDFWWQNIS